MIKLIIADDERIIRETISNLIDWKSLGITLVGLAKDGNEAYNMILDECPDKMCIRDRARTGTWPIRCGRNPAGPSGR